MGHAMSDWSQKLLSDYPPWNHLKLAQEWCPGGLSSRRLRTPAGGTYPLLPMRFLVVSLGGPGAETAAYPNGRSEPAPDELEKNERDARKQRDRQRFPNEWKRHKKSTVEIPAEI